MCDHIWENDRFAIFVIALLLFTLIEDSAVNLKPIRRSSLRVRHTPYSLFSLESSCLNDYFLAYAIIDYLVNRLVFPNKVIK